MKAWKNPHKIVFTKKKVMIKLTLLNFAISQKDTSLIIKVWLHEKKKDLTYSKCWETFDCFSSGISWNLRDICKCLRLPASNETRRERPFSWDRGYLAASWRPSVRKWVKSGRHMSDGTYHERQIWNNKKTIVSFSDITWILSIY